jgi:carboxyl-terminal processing protease
MKGHSMNLTREQRGAMLSKIEQTVAEKYYDPAFNPAAWQGIVAKHRAAIIDAPSTAVFEQAIRNMLWEFSPKSLGLLSKTSPVNSRNAISASFAIEPALEGFRWAFQDVLPGGVAEKAGVHSGDILLTAAGKPMTPATASSAEPSFEMADSIPISIRRGSPGQELSLSLQTGEPKYKDNPYSDLTALKPEVRKDGIAYLRVSLFPGKIGIDFANELDRIFREQFRSTDKLIIDLRGNPGGGIGGLTLMSYLSRAE